jgi:RNA polymerase sigma-70 factor (ECF subfamily)
VEVVLRAKNGDGPAFEDLVALVGDRCFALAYRIVRSRTVAEDAVQQALLSAWRDLPRLRDPERFEAWLYRTLLRACYAELRRHRRWSGMSSALPDELPGGPDPSRVSDDRDALERAFARLSPDRRAIFMLHHHSGFPLPQVAEIVGIPLGTAKSRLHYATQTLRSALIADTGPAIPEAPRP